MKILVVGAGATGGFFGARLALAGRDVTFLVREHRAQQLARDGLRIISPAGDFSIAPKTVTTAHITQPFDLIVLATKSYSLAAALEDMAAAVGPQTVILPMLNGMIHMDLIAAKFGKERLLGCACKVITSLDDEGRVVQQGTFSDMAYGELDGSETPRLALVHNTLSDSGFDARTSAHIARDMWEKWILLASLGGINSLFRGTIGEVASAEGGVAAASRIVDEVVSIVRAVGVAPSEAFVAEAHRVLTLKDSNQTSSMYRDLCAGRPVEAAQIIGDLIVRAERAGVAAPHLSQVYVSLQIYQAHLSALAR